MNRKILLVDEWRAVRLLGRRVVTSLGFYPREARTGLEALEVLALEPDILAVLLEWRPDDADCVEFVRRLTAAPRHARPAIIACGDVLAPIQIVAALHAGVDDFLQKPYSRELLGAKLEQLGVHGTSCRPEKKSSVC